MHTTRIIRYVLSLALGALSFSLQAQTGLKAKLSFTSSSQYISDWISGDQQAMLTIINSGATDRDFKVATELYYDGTVVARSDPAKMPVTSLAAGATLNIRAEEFYPVNSVDYYGKFKIEDVVRTGKVWPGVYRFCTRLVDIKSGADLTVEECKTFNVREFELTVVAPVNNAVLSAADAGKLTFRWLMNPAATGVTYELKIYEIPTGGSARDAVNTVPIYNAEVKNRLSLFYPIDAPRLNAGQKYAFTISDKNDNGQPLTHKGRSDVFVFSVEGGKSFTEGLTLISPANGGSLDTVKQPTFTWEHNGKDQNYTFFLTEIEDGQSPAVALKSNKMIFTKNDIKEKRFVYPSTAEKLQPGKKYAWSVQAGTGPGNEPTIPFTFDWGIPCNETWCTPAPQALFFCNTGPYVINVPYTITTVGPCFTLVRTFKYQVDNGPITQIGLGASTISLSSLSAGQHTVTFTVWNWNGTLNTNFPPCVVIVNIFPYNIVPTIDKIDICNGESATLNIPGLPFGHNISWIYRDGPGGWTTTGPAGYPSNTNQINVNCSPTPSAGYIPRYYRPVIAGYPATCLPIAPELKVWCPPGVGTISGPTKLCMPPNVPVNLIYSPEQPFTNYQWSLLLGPTTVGPAPPLNTTNWNIPIFPSTPGQYRFQVTVSNGACQPAIIPHTIDVANPLAAVVTSTTSAVCPYEDANLKLVISPPGGNANSATIAWQYSTNCTDNWTYMNSSGNPQNTNPIGIQQWGPYPGPEFSCVCYRAIVTSTDGICTDPIFSIPKRICVNHPPCPPTITGTPVKCPLKSVELKATNIMSCNPLLLYPGCSGCPASTPVKWQWTLNGIPIPGATNQTFKTTNIYDEGNYTVVASNGCGSATSAVFKVQNCNYIIEIKGPCCSDSAGKKIQLCTTIASQPDPPCGQPGPAMYRWFAGSTPLGPPSTTPCIWVSPTATTTYTVEITGLKCPAKASKTITICKTKASKTPPPINN